jgi:Undecaprenyl-phosphate galactose phosphotransferase WbaP
MLFQTTRGYSRAAITIAGILTALLAQPIRTLVRCCLFRMGIGQIPVVIAGSGVVAQRVAAVIATDAYIGLKLVGYFSGEREDTAHVLGTPCLGTYKDIVPESIRRDVKILLACQDERIFRAQVRDFSEWFHYVEFLPRAETFPIFGSRAVNIDGVGGLEMVNLRSMKAVVAEKRLVDLLLASVVFLMTLPFFAVLPILIKATSRGPVFYKAQRLGKNGRPIRAWKFRSMYADADRRLADLLETDPKMKKEFEKNFKLKKDPRITPIGKIMRRLSLDELPQLFNVFTGDMALVGPRPIVEAEVEYYGKDYEMVSHVKPGITGLWQTSGRSDTGYTRRVALDLYYVLNWSPWLDIWIVMRTVWKVLFMQGAY